MKIVKLGFVVAFAFVAATLFVSAQAKRASVRKEASPRSLFLQNCATCHGSNGKAQTARGKKLQAADLTSSDVKSDSTAKIVRTIKNGRLEMPAFGKKLTTDQISSLASYVRSL